MNQFEVRDAIIKVLRENLICIDKDTAMAGHVEKEIVVNEEWIAGRIINEIKNKRAVLESKSVGDGK